MHAFAKVERVHRDNSDRGSSQNILSADRWRVDEIDFRKLTMEKIRAQWKEARTQAGTKYLAAPGCSIPDDTTAEELRRFPQSLER
jgi:hypothetical protein